jgi:hypothetical protein
MSMTKAISKPDLEKALKMYSRPYIGKVYGVSENWISHLVLLYGIEITINCGCCGVEIKKVSCQKYCVDCQRKLYPHKFKNSGPKKSYKNLTIIKDPDEDAAFKPGTKFAKSDVTLMLSNKCFTHGTIAEDDKKRQYKVVSMGAHQVLEAI